MGHQLRVAACQISSGPDPGRNLQTARVAIDRAAAAGARIAVLPEAAMACFGTPLVDIAEPLDGPYAQGIRDAAAKHGITVAAGMFEPADDGRVHNTVLLTGPDGEWAYRKIHLFDAFGSRESETVAPGSELVTGTVAGITIGLATCYDVRFADQFSALGRAGAQLILLPASWGDGPGKAEQWDLLVRARAMDAQAWLLACDQAWVPTRGKLALGIGRSALCDPLGGVRAQLGHTADILVTDIDLDAVTDTRQRV
ncbi:MAG: carbon-nitrogen hydrolase family protein, partial [Micrococcales bacterium]|nr:carbon-nitrogen hydrolase family protein [Micrococcales bacterium]